MLHNILFKMALKKKLVFACFNLILFISILKLSEIPIANASVDVEVTASVAEFGDEYVYRYIVKNVGEDNAAESVYEFEVRHKGVKPTDHTEPNNWAYTAGDGVISWSTSWAQLKPKEMFTFSYFTLVAPPSEVLWRALDTNTGDFDFGMIYIGDDTTPPSTPKVRDEAGKISWESSDPESGIAEYQYAIGTTQGGTDVVDWKSVGANTFVIKDELGLKAGTYYFAVKAKNGSGLWSLIGTSDGIIIGTTTQGQETAISEKVN